MMSSDSKYIEYAKDDGYQIITIPDNLNDRVSSALDVKGNEIMDIEKYAVEWNENFEFEFVKSLQLSKSEKDIFALKEAIVSWFPSTNNNVKEILISNVMRPDDYSGNDAAGLWIPSDRRIIIHRNQLKK